MKKQYLLLLAAILLCAVPKGIAQEYLELLQNPKANTTLQEVQQLAETYFANKDLGRGSGYKQYKRWEYKMERMVNEDGLIRKNFNRMTLDAALEANAIDLAGTAGNNDILNMAYVGRARVRLDLGNASGAAADAGKIPEDFVKNATYSTASERRENRIYDYNHRRIMVSVDPRFRELEVQGTPDPRVPVTDAGRLGHDGVTDLWFQELYPEAGSPIPLATWDEAQLIIAEAEGGQAAVAAINLLREKEGLPLFESSDSQEITNQIIEERRRELWLQSHRLNDMLRFGLPFDTGVNHKDQIRGTTTCLPLPDAERKSNPNLGGS